MNLHTVESHYNPAQHSMCQQNALARRAFQKIPHTELQPVITMPTRRLIAASVSIPTVTMEFYHIDF